MHVQPAQEIALADHLQVLHDRVVALLCGLLGLAPERSRMRAGRQNGEAVIGGHRGDGSPQVAQLGAGGGHVLMGRRGHLDLRLQEFGRGPAIGCRSGRFEERSGHIARHELRGGIDEEILLFDTDRERAGHREPLLLGSCGGGVIHCANPGRVANASDLVVEVRPLFRRNRRAIAAGVPPERSRGAHFAAKRAGGSQQRSTWFAPMARETAQ